MSSRKIKFGVTVSISLLLLLVLFLPALARGDVTAPIAPQPPLAIESANTYVFSYTTATYTEIAGTTSTATGDDGTELVTLPFTFKYDGVNYTQGRISTNGYFQLGTGTTSLPYSNDLASTTNKPFLGALWDDLYDDATSVISYTTQGIAPDRIYIIQWKGIRWYGSTGTAQNFQIKLYETSNIIEFAYGAMTAPASTPGASIGINDATGGSGHYLSVTPANPPTVSSTTANNSIAAITFLPSGTVYRFTPPPPAPGFSSSTKTVSPAGTRFTGDVLTYTIGVINSGDLASTATTLSDPIPTGTTYVPGSAALTGSGTLTSSASSIDWAGALGIGERVTVTFQVTLTAINGSVTNTATISDPLLSAAVVKTVNTVVAVPNYSTSTKVVSSQVHPGQRATYTVTLINSGLVAGTSTTLSDPMPTGATYVDSSAQVAGGGTLTATASSIDWSSSIAPAGRVTITFQVTLTALSGSVVNSATINDPLLLTPVVKSATTVIQPPTGGPDGGGYAYKDSYASGGPTFTWVFTTGASTLIPSFTGGNDDGYAQIPLGFDFHFYTGVYSQPFVSTNGLVSFGAGVSTAANAAIPTSSTPNNFAACFWDDLINEAAGQGVWYETFGSAPNRYAVVTWRMAAYAGTLPSPYEFQAILYEGSDQILCQYRSMTGYVDGNGASATVGVENAAGTVGQSYSYNTAGAIENNLAILFNPGVGYAGSTKSVQPIGSVTPGQVLTYTVVVANGGALTGATTLNDPIPAGTTYVPGSAALTGGGTLTATASAIDWSGSLVSGDRVTVTFQVTVTAISNAITNTATISDPLLVAPVIKTASNSIVCNLPTGLSFTYNPSAPLINQTIDVSGTTVSGLQPFVYTWDFADSSPIGTGNPITHAYTVAATYNTVMTVTNLCGANSYTAPITVTAAPTPPTLGPLQSSGPTVLGNPTYFTGTLTAGSVPITYTWDFGDGTVLDDGLNISHTFASVDQFTVTLTAVNIVGTDAATSTLRVGLPPTATFDVTPNPTYYPDATTFAFTGNPGTGPTEYLWTIGNLTYTVEFFTATLAAPAPINNYTSTLRVSNPFGVAVTGTVVTVLNTSADLSITKSASSASVGGTQALTYTLAVTNSGPNFSGAILANPMSIAIPSSGTATPYPSAINVSGITDPVGQVKATLYGINHTFPDDIEVLLVGPAGQAVVLMANAGGSNAINGVTLTFDDNATGTLPDSAQITSGTYKPTLYDTTAFPVPAPAGPYSSTLSTFNGVNPNGVWNLYVYDDASGDLGAVPGGWSLNLTTSQLLTTTVTDTLPAGYTFGSASGNGWACVNNAGTVTCTRSVLPLGAAPNIVIAGNAPLLVTSGDITNTATVSSDLPDFNLINNTATITTFVNALRSDLGILKTDSPDPVGVGGTVTYQITVTNNGPDATGSVVAVDTLPASFQFASASAGCANVAGTVTCAIGSLNNGQSASVSIVVTATALGTYTNTVAVSSANPDLVSGNNTASATTTVASPEITLNPTSLGAAQVPNVVTTQTLTINNAGPVALNWSLFESLPVFVSSIDQAVAQAAPFNPAQLARSGDKVNVAASAPTEILPTQPRIVTAAFSEGFDDVTTLPGKGWAQINRSNPLGGTSWYQGVGTVFPAHTGAISTSYVAANYNNTSGAGTISNWLLTPETQLTNGSVFTFYTRVPSPVSYPDRLEVRLSVNGASTDVGTTESSVGDFTTLLLTVNPNLTTIGYPTVWTAYSVTISGLGGPTNGRIGFRYYVTDGGPSGNNSSYVGIDTFSYVPVATACSTPADLPWLSALPTSGTTTAGGNSTVNVQFNSTGLAAGVYTGTLCVASNDATDLLKTVPVTLTVQSACEPIGGLSFTPNPAAPRSGQSVQFTASVVTGTLPITYAWNFGDTGTGNGSPVNHVFPVVTAATAYTVTLTASNACPSQAQVSQMIVVNPYILYLPLVRK